MRKRIFSLIISLTLLLTFTCNVFAEEKKIDLEYSKILVVAVQLDEKFVGHVGLNGDFVKLDNVKAIQNDISYKEIQEAEEKINEYNKIIEDVLSIQPYIQINDTEIIFDEKGAEENKVSRELINSTKEDIEKMNDSVVSTEPNNKLKQSSAMFSSAASCSGQSKYVSKSYGYDTFFDSCESNKLIGYLTVGAGVATIAAAVTGFIAPPVGVAVGIAAGLLTIGVGVVTAAAANGCGIKIRWTSSPNNYPIGTSSQC